MIGAYAYCCARMGQGKRQELEELFKHLAWLCNDAVAYCRKQYAEYGSTLSGLDLNKRLTEMRDCDDHAASKSFLRSAPCCGAYAAGTSEC